MEKGREIAKHLDKIYEELVAAYNSKGYYKGDCKKILNSDESIRFVGRIKDDKIIDFARKENAKPLLDEEMSNWAHYQASVKARMEEMFDESLGKTNWTITSKERVKLITLFLDDGLLILSIENYGDQDKVIKKIESMDIVMNK